MIELRRVAASRWAMYNLDESIRGFARSCMNYALTASWPLYLSTKNTILKAYDGRFKDIFQEIFDAEFASEFAAKGITVRAPADRRHGGAGPQVERRHRLGVQELRRRRAVGHRGTGLRLARHDDLRPVTPDGQTVEAEAAHGTVTRHYRAAPARQGDLDQPDRLDLRVDARPRAPRKARRQRRPPGFFARRSSASASRRSRPAR